MLGIWGVDEGPVKLRDGTLEEVGGEGGPLKLKEGIWEDEVVEDGGPPKEGGLDRGEEGGPLKLEAEFVTGAGAFPTPLRIVDTGGESSRSSTSRILGVRGKGGTPAGQVSLTGVPLRPAAANINVLLPPPSIIPGALLPSKADLRISGGWGSVDARASIDGGRGKSRIPYCGEVEGS
jgi:hypothetical protein